MSETISASDFDDIASNSDIVSLTGYEEAAEEESFMGIIERGANDLAKFEPEPQPIAAAGDLEVGMHVVFDGTRLKPEQVLTPYVLLRTFFERNLAQ